MKKPTRKEILKQIRLWLESEKIKEKDDLSDLGFDSIERMDLHLNLEDEFGIIFDQMNETSVKKIIDSTIGAVKSQRGIK